jgi:hypothetical protein
VSKERWTIGNNLSIIKKFIVELATIRQQNLQTAQTPLKSSQNSSDWKPVIAYDILCGGGNKC